ncbi:hypothetical protein GCM10011574_64360 [Microbispora bryophytorum]|uniref:Uncharacterized protein n=1 Tax=Microbispora bryophytorum TaxID=1460882 RepID=A0A8H9H666_9ACTN|nr:hypothetical protein GCM10011574_64360 [Microbispora bryophytorum]
MAGIGRGRFPDGPRPVVFAPLRHHLQAVEGEEPRICQHVSANSFELAAPRDPADDPRNHAAAFVDGVMRTGGRLPLPALSDHCGYPPVWPRRHAFTPPRRTKQWIHPPFV